MMSGGIGIPAGPAMVLALGLLLCSCSVKEDRRACPCYVRMEVGEFLHAGLPEALVSFSSGGGIRRSEVDLSEFRESGLVQSLPRGAAGAALAAGLDCMEVRGDSLVVPYGKEADPLWLYAEKFVCDGDEKHLQAVPCKQYCTLTIVVSGLEDVADHGMTLSVMAGSCALDIYSARPLAGAYRAVARRSGASAFQVRIPRQSGYGLLLEILVPSGGEDGQENLSRVLDLGSEFRKAGYDWQRRNLQDASALVDYSGAEISLSIGDWDVDGSFGDIEI